MNRYSFIWVTIIACTITGYLIWQPTSKQSSIVPQSILPVDITPNKYGNTTLKNDFASEQNLGSIVKRVRVDWKTYIDKKLGFTFQYPSTWLKQHKDVEVVNLSGVTTAIGVYFSDTLSKTTFSVDYHLGPNGLQLYQYALSQYNSAQGWYAAGRKKIQVAGNDAIQAFTTLSVDGKGKILNPSLRLIIVDFLDKQQTGEIELQFKTPLPHDNIEVGKFKRLLSTFKFLGKD